MNHVTFTPKGVCSMQIDFDIDDEKKLHNVSFIGGCNGNLKAIGKLVEGKDAAEIADILRGNQCGMRGTSCADQFAQAIDGAVL
ncbi:MAG: TIGR03905 family TSCPD domain-containing protein [Eubacterium sp.]|nr:TIGR03905 family TSCPD domain-containing protein [Eubacterium sp.]